MNKKFLFAFLIFMLSCSQIQASEYTDSILPGLWNIEGTSFAEKSFVRISFRVKGEMNLKNDILKNVNASLDKVLDGTSEISRGLVNENRKVLTSSEVDLRLYMFDKTGFDLKIWSEHIDNAVTNPILLPEVEPTLSKPYELPTIKVQDLNLTVTFTSESSGKLRVKGYANLDTIGVCEINADCALWRDGTTMPLLSEETYSGCNVGFKLGIIAALLIFAIERGKKFCSGQI